MIFRDVSINYSDFDFPKHKMVERVFERDERLKFDIRNYDNATTTKLKLWLDNYIGGNVTYLKSHMSYEFGAVSITFYIAMSGDYICICDYENFSLKSIRFLKDDTVIKQFRRI